MQTVRVSGSMQKVKRCLLALLFGSLTLWAALPSGLAIENTDCFECHADKKLTKSGGDGKKVSLYVDGGRYTMSAHGTNRCTTCHTDINDLPHPEKLAPVQCANCHRQAGKEYSGSIHGFSVAAGISGAARCVDCHGSHEILPSKDPASSVFKLNLPATCGKCHSSPALAAEYKLPYPSVEKQYMESIHGKAMVEKGLIIVPSCNDCHGVHNIRRSVDQSSPVNHANVSHTCGKCHVGVEGTYAKSVHGQLLGKGDKRAPNCVDCHSAHEIEAPKNTHFKMASDQRCGRCHEERLKNYRETYHGKAMALGRPNVAPEVASCYDCHGHHDVLPPSNPASHLSSTNILGTCQKCHPKATPKFTQYIPHADPMDSKHYPVLHTTFVFMTALLIGVFLFFGVHTAFWLFRMIYLYVSDSKRFREAKTMTQKGDEWFVRFSPFERFLHLLVVTSFLLLVTTGIPLKFYETAWAGVIFRLLGGPDVARVLHHFGAIITLLYFGLHLSSLACKAWKGLGKLRDPETGRWTWRRFWGILFSPDSMIPNLQDWRDFVAHQRWFFGKGPRPQFDRWTYWEKFDYLAVFWGVAMIGFSGLIMWFPEFFARFLPGWVINIALIVHSDEALLAAGFIFSFHFFNTHFRPDKFPMDTVIFSGRVSKAEMLHERKRWYDRLTSTGRIDQQRVGDEWERTRPIARTMGFLFFGLGVVLLVLIVYAMTVRLHTGGEGGAHGAAAAPLEQKGKP